MIGTTPLKEAQERQKKLRAQQLERISRMLGGNATLGQVKTIAKNMVTASRRKSDIPEWTSTEVLHSVRGPNKYQVLENWYGQKRASKNLKARAEQQRELNQLFGMQRKHQREEAIHDYFDRQNREYDREQAEKEMYKHLTDEQKTLYEHRKDQLETQENTPGNLSVVQAEKLFFSHIPNFVREEITDNILPIEKKSRADSSNEFARGDSDTSIRKRYQTTLRTIQKLEDEGKVSEKQRSRILFNLLQSYKKSGLGDKIVVRKNTELKELSNYGPLKIAGPRSEVIEIKLEEFRGQVYPTITSLRGKHPKPYDGFVPVKRTAAKPSRAKSRSGAAET